MHFHYNFMVICNISLIFKLIFLKQKMKLITNPIHLNSDIYIKIGKQLYHDEF